MADVTPAEPESTTIRRYLAFGPTGLSAILVFALAIVIIATDHEHRSDTARYVLTAVLPLVGTWVGTILAIIAWTRPADKDKLLFDIREELAKQKKGQRIPILSDANHPLYVIHQSTIDKYLADQFNAQPVPDRKTLTLQKFLDDNKDSLKSTSATVKEDATLADAKDAMDSTRNCQDVFVTKAGAKDEEVLGWITNNILQDNAKV